jgi:hypothetical protein
MSRWNPLQCSPVVNFTDARGFATAAGDSLRYWYFPNSEQHFIFHKRNHGERHKRKRGRRRTGLVSLCNSTLSSRPLMSDYTARRNSRASQYFIYSHPPLEPVVSPRRSGRCSLRSHVPSDQGCSPNGLKKQARNQQPSFKSKVNSNQVNEQ